MNHYAILNTPGHNRVYYNESKKLAKVELAIAFSSFKTECFDIREEYIADISYIVFTTHDELCEGDVDILSRLSFAFAVFKRVRINEETYLLPITKSNFRYVDENINTILKYSGKTNEVFTQMLINIGRYSLKGDRTKIRLLDPVAGRGTTLFTALMMGYDVSGVEIGHTPVHEVYIFLKKYLEEEKYKHTIKKDTLHKGDKKLSAQKYSFELARTKEDFKSENTKLLDIVCADSKNVDKYYKKNYFDLIVGDLPYGVHHGNITNERQTNVTRDCSMLLRACLSSWKNVLKVGGVMVFAWNSFTCPREDIVRLVELSGLEVLHRDYEFLHRVDQSINRDVIVCMKR